jgi:DNA-binding response OmpR family regulator
VAAALRAFHQHAPDAAILDINLPDGSGYDLCSALRRESSLPILMLTARTEESDQVRALELEADDYLTKPYSPRTLVARLKAVLRRAGGSSPQRLRVGALQLDVTALELGHGEQLVRLTPREARLMQCLMAQAGAAVPAPLLLHEVWGERDQDRQLLKQLVHRLRLKLESAGMTGVEVETVPNVGYRLRP